MRTLKEQFIAHVVEEAVKRAGGTRAPRIMDLGCGTAAYVPQLMEKVADFEYIGVEPIKASYDAAVENLKDVPNAKVHFQLGYDEVPDESEGSFDLVFSLSALEHIKQLKRFIALSSKYTKTGGLVVHRYDLGHALYPHSLKERVHVWLGNTVPNILPERQFVRYVGVPEVESHYEATGLRPTNVTYHQMPNHKHLEKFFKETDTNIIEELFAWEVAHQEEFKQIPESHREKLFPAVAVWGEKE